MKIKKFILYITLIISVFILGACSPKVKNTSQIKKDLVGQSINLNSKAESALLGDKCVPISEVKELEIIKRQSDKESKTDFIHAKAKISNEIATIETELEIYYGLYDDKGWVINGVYSVTVPKITPNKDITIEEIKPLYSKLFQEGEGKITKSEVTEKGTNVEFEISVKRNGYTAIYSGTALMEFVLTDSTEKPIIWRNLAKDLKDTKVIFDTEFVLTPEKLKKDATETQSRNPFAVNMLNTSEIKNITIDSNKIVPFLDTFGQVGVEITDVKVEMNSGEIKTITAKYLYNEGTFYFDDFYGPF